MFFRQNFLIMLLFLFVMSYCMNFSLFTLQKKQTLFVSVINNYCLAFFVVYSCTAYALRALLIMNLNLSNRSVTKSVIVVVVVVGTKIARSSDLRVCVKNLAS